MKKLLIFVTICTLSIAGCSPHAGQKEQTGTLLGASAGALLGSHIGSGKGSLVAVAIGTLAGALIEQDIGRSLDQADKLAMERNGLYALEHAPTNTSPP